MGRLKRAWQWVKAADTTFSLLDLAIRIIGVSTVLSALVGGITWLLANPYAALVIGLGSWIAIAILLLLVMARRAGPSAPLVIDTEPGTPAPQPTPTDIDSHQAQEAKIKQLRSELREVTQERDQLKITIEGQEERLSEWEGDRLRFKEVLTDAWREGTNLRGKDPSEEAQDWKEAREWQRRIRYLLERSVGKDIADNVLRDDPQFQSGQYGATGAQKFLELRLHRVDRLKQNVAKHSAIPFRSGFDPYEWKDWKTPPEVASDQRPGYWDNRQMLHAALKDFWAETNYLDNEDAYDDGEVKE